MRWWEESSDDVKVKLDRDDVNDKSDAGILAAKAGRKLPGSERRKRGGSGTGGNAAADETHEAQASAASVTTMVVYDPSAASAAMASAIVLYDPSAYLNHSE